MPLHISLPPPLSSDVPVSGPSIWAKSSPSRHDGPAPGLSRGRILWKRDGFGARRSWAGAGLGWDGTTLAYPLLHALAHAGMQHRILPGRDHQGWHRDLQETQVTRCRRCWVCKCSPRGRISPHLPVLGRESPAPVGSHIAVPVQGATGREGNRLEVLGLSSCRHHRGDQPTARGTAGTGRACKGKAASPRQPHTFVGLQSKAEVGLGVPPSAGGTPPPPQAPAPT